MRSQGEGKSAQTLLKITLISLLVSPYVLVTFPQGSLWVQSRIEHLSIATSLGLHFPMGAPMYMYKSMCFSPIYLSYI